MMTLAYPHMTISLETMTGTKKEAILEMRAMMVQSHPENEGDLMKCVFNKSYGAVLQRYQAVDCVGCRCRGQWRGESKGSEPSESGRHEGQAWRRDESLLLIKG